MSKKCEICNRPARDFNYGVQSCNACKMFFRRHVVRTLPLKPCFGLESCYDVTSTFLDCQFCRFHKCIQSGMTLQSLLRKSTFPELIHFISNLDYNRNFSLLNCYPIDPRLTVSSVIPGQVQYSCKPPLMNFHSWTYISTVSTIDFIKQFPFLYFSKSQDQSIIVNAYFIKVASFCAAYRAFLGGFRFLSFPDGSDILPISGRNVELENCIKYRLVGKLYELQIRNEEFLLVLVILFSNPAIPNLSPTARILCSAYRNLYSSALMDYCMLTYQKFGPTRFTDLLSISNVIAKHYEDINRYFVLLQLSGTEFQLDGIVKEGLDLL